MPTKVFFVCSGLGRTNRGYESFMRQAFDVLKGRSDFDIRLFKGGGASGAGEKVLWNLPRGRHLTGKVAALLGRDAYVVEQLSFTLSLLPHLIVEKPDVVYFSDGNVGNLLWRWRGWSRQKYKLVFRNGGPLDPPFPRWDLVQQMAPMHLEDALAAGEPPEKHRMLSHGIALDAQWEPPSAEEKQRLRNELGLPQGRPLIISVAALNFTHKRLDYLIEEVANLPAPRPFLLMLGQHGDESQQVIELARARLEREDYAIKTVAPDAVASHLRAADAFVLSSLREGLGRVFLEAAAQGLPCLTHDYSVARYALGDRGYFADLTQSGALTRLLQTVLAQEDTPEQKIARHRETYRRFSWDALAPSYVEMFKDASSPATSS